MKWIYEPGEPSQMLALSQSELICYVIYLPIKLEAI